MSKGANRRDFIKYTAATGIGFWVAAQKTLAEQVSSRSPNERVNFACIGLGGKGESDSSNCGQVGNVVAICDTNEEQLDRKANEFPKAKKFNDYRKMFDAMGNEFDAITVSIPDHNHAAAAMMGVKNGKGVYCQKPMTHYVAEARALRLAANEHKVATQLGNQGTATNGLREGVEAIQAGVIGAVKEVHIWTNRPIWPQAPKITDRPMTEDEVPKHLNWDAWLGPAPYRPYVEHYKNANGRFDRVYQPFNWRGWWDWGTGALGDMGCHTANLPFMALKLAEVYPTSIKAESGIVNPETYPSWATVTYEFPERGDMPPIKVIWYEGQREIGEGRREHNYPAKELFHGQRIRESGSLMVGERGSLYSPDDYGANWKLLPEEDFKDFQKPPRTLPVTQGDNDLWMKREWAAAIKGGPPALSNFNYSGKLTEFILLGNVAIRAGVQHPIEWDGENAQVKNWPEANSFLKREYRKGWEL